MELPSSWYSWSALKGGRARKPFRLSASVDSIPYADNDFFSSVGSLTNFPDYEDDGSVNNILDAAGLTASWSILEGVGTTNSSVVAKGDNESSGLGSAGTNSSASPTGSSVPQNEDYEHVYCQLVDPYFSPPTININKSQQGSTRASLRSWGRSATMETDPGIIPFLQHALLLRYREILNTYMQHAPPWCPTHYLEDVYPTVYQVVPSIYGTCSSELQHDTYKPILPHQIFAKMGEDDNPRVFWLEGEAGSGKTLFCSKIVSEWVSHNSYTSSSLNSRIGEFQVIFYVPLREVRSSLLRFILQDLIPKRSVLKRMKPAHVVKCLNLLGRSMLLILDGLDDCNMEVLKEAEDILNGQMFPQSLVLLTSRPMMIPLDNSLMASGHVRKYLVNGMHNTQIMCFIRRYFTGRKFRNESQMVDILSDRPDLFSLASNPLMCLLLCSVFEEVGDLPTNAELYLCLIRSLIYQNGLVKVGDPSYGSSCKDSRTIPLKYEEALRNFGKLCLHKLGDSTIQYSEAEVSGVCQNFEILKCGILTKWKGFFRKTSKKSSAHTLKLLHPSFNTFLAAYYLASTVNNPTVFRRDMELLPGFETLLECQVRGENVAFSVLQLVMELLQENSCLAFSTLSLMDISLNYLLALLRAAGFYESNVRSVCALIRSLKHLCIQNQNQRWLSEIKQVLASGVCPFQSLEIVIKPGFSLCRLMEGLLLNKSISQVKFTSIPGQDWNEMEVNLICGQLIQLLIDKKLKCLEISMTCLDMEDKEHSRFQPIVDSLCYVLSKQIPLQKLVLDMDLTSSQLQQLASYIKCHTYIQILQLPHLGCGPEGMRAISSCLPLLSSLNLAGTWRSNDDVDVIEQTPFYSSLSRGPLNGTLKSPSIRRKKLNQLAAEDDKRNSDTALFQRNFLPLPICDQANHEFDGFHPIFAGLRNLPGCKLHSLDVSKCVLNWEDVICLGETIRKATCLESLRMEGMKLCDVLPLLLGMQENTSLKMVHLSSPHVVIGDDALQLACQSLSQNRTLRLLAVQGWTFYVEEERSLASLENFFASTNIQDLDLTNVRVHISSPSKNSKGGNVSGSNSDKNSMTSTLDKKLRKEVKSSKEKMTLGSRVGKKCSLTSVMSVGLGGLKKVFPNLSFLRIGGMHIEFGKSQSWRSMDIATQLFPFLDRGKITHLDLSLLPAKSDTNFVVEEKVMLKTLKLIGQSLPKLQRLVIQHWRVKISERGAKEAFKYLTGLDTLSSICLDNCVVTCDGGSGSGNGGHSNSNSNSSKRIDHLLASSILSSVKNLSDFSWANFDPSQMTQLGRVLSDHHHIIPTMGLSVKLESVPLTAIKLLINNPHPKYHNSSTSSSSSSSSSSNVVIEYSGNNSVIVRKSKDKGDHLMYKIMKLL